MTNRLVVLLSTIALAFVLGGPGTAQAVPGDHLWSKGAPGEGIAAVDGSGNVIMCGNLSQAYDFGGGQLTPVTFSEKFYAVFDSDGNHITSGIITPTSGGLNINAVAADPAGNWYISGIMSGEVDFGGGPLTGTSQTVYCAKFDAGMNHQWSAVYGASAPVRGMAVNGSHVAICGGLIGTVDFGGGPLNAGPQSDIYIGVLNTADGSHAWSMRAGDVDIQRCEGVVFDGSGNLIAVGGIRGGADFGGGTLTATSGLDMFLAKYNAAGVHQWSQLITGDFGTSYLDAAIDADAAGNILVGGTFGGTANMGGAALLSDGFDALIATYDASGTHTMSKAFVITNTQGLQGACFDGSGNIVIAGITYGSADFGGGPLPAGGSWDVFIASVDGSGNHIWSHQFGEGANDFEGRPDVFPNGDVLLYARTGPNVSLGGTVIGTSDLKIGKYDGAGVASGITPDMSGYAFEQNYPNPFNPTTTIGFTLPSEAHVDIKVFDVQGRLVRTLASQMFDAGSSSVSWNGLDDAGVRVASGVYYYRLRTGDITQSRKMVLLK